MARGLVIAAPRTGSGKTLVTLGLVAALRRRGLAVAPAKTGPDYIDRTILARTAGREAINLDPWAMAPARLAQLASRHAAGADLLLVEGVMGLFDGAADGTGSTADLAAALGLGTVLVVDAEGQGQSVAALVGGFAGFRADVGIVGIILNRVASARHEDLLAAALAPLGLPLLGALPRDESLLLPARHLGLVLPGEVTKFDATVAAAAARIEARLDLDRLLAISADFSSAKTMKTGEMRRLPPLGQRIAVARDDAFAFLYPHLLDDWRAQGGELSFFSPLADEPPEMNSDAVYLPGGYPELHGAAIARADRFRAAMTALAARGALIYGECGGYMVLGEQLTDRDGVGHAMLGLLPVSTDISQPRRHLGYRRLTQRALPIWPAALRGHEFHYSRGSAGNVPPLFEATDARGERLPPMGAVIGRVMGSYAHVIDVA